MAEKITIGGREFTVSSVSLYTAKQITRLERSLPSLDSEGALTAMAEAIRLVLAKDSPDLTAEEVEKLIEFPSLGEVYRKVLVAGGFKVASPGEAASP